MTAVAMGYCRECDRLYHIVAKGHINDRQRAWYPVKHPKLGDDTGGEDCPGMKKPL